MSHRFSTGHDVVTAANGAAKLILEEETWTASADLTDGDLVALNRAAPSTVVQAATGAANRIIIGVVLETALGGSSVRVLRRGRHPAVKAIAATAADVALFASATAGTVDDAAVANGQVVGWSLAAEAGGFISAWIEPGMAVS
jgi:hypothetical protein